MFVYTVYGVNDIRRNRSVPWVTSVEGVNRVEAALPVQRSWIEQQRLRRAYDLQEVNRISLQKAGHTQEFTGGPNRGGVEAEPKTSTNLYIQNMQGMLQYRQPAREVEPDYIQRYLERLNHAQKEREYS